jgi:predicted CopG family antitoxin
MGTKTIRLDEDVYERIKAHKEPDETFSEAIDRLTDSWSLLELADTLDEEEAEAHREAIEQSETAGKEAARDLLERQGIDP